MRHRDAAWTKAQMQRSVDRFTSIFNIAPKTHGAAGWQMNAHAFAQLDELGITYSSDSRAQLKDDGSLVDPQLGPYRLSVEGKTCNSIQLPTTLPTLDELLGRTIHGTKMELNNIAESLVSG